METTLASPPQPKVDDISLKSCKSYLDQLQEYLTDQFNLGVHVVELVQLRSSQMDLLLKSLWQHFGLNVYQDLSLLAVGGYGRGELHPRSDIDILIVSRETIAKEAADKVSAFITLLWDIRLDVGQSVRTLAECLELGLQDITIATNLQESRLLVGNKDIYTELCLAVCADSFWPSEAFFRAKKDEQQSRHRQYKGNAYSLEPDIKANPGGLRDIQTICWVAGRHFGSSDLEELTKQNFLTQAECRELQDCRDFLWRVRFALHIHLTKSDDRLLFDRQLAVAQSLGYAGDHNAPVERLMKHFFQTIRRISELNEMLLQLFDEAILGNTAMDVQSVDENFMLRGNLIDSNHASLFLQHPEQILVMFLHIADNPKITGIYSATLRQLREARRRLTHWLQDIPECRRNFRRLMKHPNVTGLPLTLMHRYGVLSTYFPAWSRIVGQMQFDLFHAFTVDEHTHRLITKIHSFNDSKTKDTHPLCCEIYPRLERPDLLVLAAIFHDIAKGRKGDHSTLGAVDAEEFCLAHGYSKPSARTVAWLVKHHLLMSVIAQKRDIYDPEVISEFAKVVRDQRHLDLLLCLTVADICATNDDTWNSWKRTLLSELYNSTQKALRRGLENPVDIRGVIRDKQLKAIKCLELKGYSEEQVRGLWQRFRVDYFLRHTPQQIAWHTDNLWGHSDEEALVLVSRRATRGGTEIFIHCPDIPHLFASVAAELDQKNLTIHDAQIMSSRDGYVLDTFVVLDRDGEPLSLERGILLQQTLATKLHVAVPIDLKQRRVPRQVQQFSIAPRVEFLPTKGNRTLIEIVSLDKPGLLARISAVFQSFNYTIHAAKVSTIGEKAEDFFSISNCEREKLSPEQKQQLKSILEQALKQ
ncbi:bifunctional uridylyltransferase/uridylyl-removing protein GlnD [Agarivorans sp. MS3-6]|uniref:bifunctional uridylyltransferase/uridylyl-removing protein GlnD n=1 Tax=Agarivorans sp. TSD2052 TaxID=2937286 RepID=UPI00200EC0DD|nr:bifunctional uridylyltransferase/uridylyl-removing protein GlnD [Agarivorans sp. TSD2052]UPW17152.1 bifunctional uridylyltransferase/uridylyl-removing protein GlnD [Agarivorans sp. TSD2052]